ncbi:hypothetical protein ACLMAJ_35880 [Nocardia sp. KC 131]|uniref:hypothetical protein n=1 Tax=Nocardia arseniciresistens TaxID=3392119 RepID=UPI00398E44BF
MDDLELQPPTVASARHTGMVMDVVAIGLADPLAAADETTRPYIRCTDNTIFRLPKPLHDWAFTVITATDAHGAARHPAMFPRQIEFGILDGTMYAELL